MIIIAGYSLTDATKRNVALAGFAEMVKRARQRDGCIDLSLSADSVDPERINLFECWRDQESLNAWRKVAKGPKGPRVKPRETQVWLYRTEKAEKPF